MPVSYLLRDLSVFPLIEYCLLGLSKEYPTYNLWLYIPWVAESGGDIPPLGGIGSNVPYLSNSVGEYGYWRSGGALEVSVRGYQWHCYPLVEVKVIQDEDRGETRYASCDDSFFSVCFVLFVAGGDGFLGGEGFLEKLLRGYPPPGRSCPGVKHTSLPCLSWVWGLFWRNCPRGSTL